MRGKKFKNLPWMKDNPSGKKHMHVRKGDKVIVCSGADRSAEAREVIEVFAESGKVLVKGVNQRWKHLARSKDNPNGGRIRKEFPIDGSKVLIYSEKAKKGVRTRSQLIDGKRVRVGTCGTRFD